MSSFLLRVSNCSAVIILRSGVLGWSLKFVLEPFFGFSWCWKQVLQRTGLVPVGRKGTWQGVPQVLQVALWKVVVVVPGFLEKLFGPLGFLLEPGRLPWWYILFVSRFDFRLLIEVLQF